jgi:hypothetical protein
MTVEGKGFFIWRVNDCEGGDPNKIALEAYKAGINFVLIKIANGIYSYNYNFDLDIDLVPPVVRALQSTGIQVWGWHYVYGYDPISEANLAIRRVKDLNLDGYVIDAESEYKESGKDTAARFFMKEIRAGLGNSLPIALSSYRYPSLHPIPWNEFLAKCDFNMPQVYWMDAHNPRAQLERSLNEFDSPSIQFHPPVVPVGAAFTEYGWTPSIGEVYEFMNTARDYNLKGVSFWEWYHCREILTPKYEMWESIADYKWDTTIPPKKDITEIYIENLNSQDIQKVVDLYDNRAVHVTAEKTIFGKDQITTWYKKFFTELLPNGLFVGTGYSGEGNTKHFTWVAQSDSVCVFNGNDTLGLYDGKIIYHYSYFSIT